MRIRIDMSASLGYGEDTKEAIENSIPMSASLGNGKDTKEERSNRKQYPYYEAFLYKKSLVAGTLKGKNRRHS